MCALWSRLSSVLLLCTCVCVVGVVVVVVAAVVVVGVLRGVACCFVGLCGGVFRGVFCGVLFVSWLVFEEGCLMVLCGLFGYARYRG